MNLLENQGRIEEGTEVDRLLDVATSDLHRSAAYFAAGATSLSKAAEILTERTNTSGAPFGRGHAGDTASDAYRQARESIASLTEQLGLLMRRHSNALARMAEVYDHAEESSKSLAQSWG
jgi:hypothetical protein